MLCKLLSVDELKLKSNHQELFYFERLFREKRSPYELAIESAQTRPLVLDGFFNQVHSAGRVFSLIPDMKQEIQPGHWGNVEKISVALGQYRDNTPVALSALRFSGVLHDSGKLHLPDKLLLKKGILSEDDIRAIKMHTRSGYHILKPIEWLLMDEALTAKFHHERFNGQGYYGLAGDKIPLAARIVGLADVIDVKSNVIKRVYDEDPTHPLSLLEAAKSMRRESGSSWDPDIVKNVLLPWISDGCPLPDLREYSFEARCLSSVNTEKATLDELKSFTLRLHRSVREVLLNILDPSGGKNLRGCQAIPTGYYGARLAQSYGLPLETVRSIYHALTEGNIDDMYLPEELEDPKLVYGFCVDITERFFATYPEYQDLVPIIRYVFEAYDGSAGLYGLKGEDIPLASRIARVAIIYAGAGVEGLLERRGGKLDPKIVDDFLKLIGKS